MITLRKFIYYSTILGIFSSSLEYRDGMFHLLYFYFLMLLNLALMAYLGRIWCPVGVSLLTIFISISGVAGVLHGSDNSNLFIKELLGITLSAVYFFSFVRLVEFDVECCFRSYARVALYVAIIGILLLPFQIDDRLHSIMAEPAAFATICLPAFYYYVDRWQKGFKAGKEVALFAVTFVLAQSSVGFIGIFLGMYLFGRRYRYGRLLAPGLILITGLGLFTLSSAFRLRFSDSVKGIDGADLATTNVSTFVLASNIFVTKQVLAEHPLMGGGIGSHFVSHERFIGDVSAFKAWNESGVTELNAYDANSLLLRVLSEMGLIGAGLLVWSIWLFRPRNSSNTPEISHAIWVYFFVMILRGGVYFAPEEFFFVALYVVNRSASGAQQEMA